MGKLSNNLGLGVGALCACAASTALAADLPVKAPALAPSSYNWTGLYVGAHAGYGGGMKDWINSSFDYVAKGPLGGLQIGVNQQIGNLVIGIEADASWTGIKGSQAFTVGGVAISQVQTATADSRIDRLVTVAGRVGIAQDRWLVYAKFGAAWARETHSFGFLEVVSPVPGIPLFTIRTAIGGSEDRFGPMLGFGTEYAFLGSWSAKLEYNYLAFGLQSVPLFGTETFVQPGLTATFPQSANARIWQSIHLVKLGVNYRFGPDAPPSIAPSRPAPGYDWTGAYAGPQVGYGFGRKAWTDFVPVREYDVRGWLAGGTLGANAQAGVFVLGFEAEWMWANIKGDTNFVTPFGGTGTQTTALSTTIDWLAVASLRAGFVAADRWLVYGKAGLALANENHAFNAAQIIPGVGTASVSLTGNALHTGYLAGVGVEHAFAGNWSAKLEYDYIALRSQRVITAGPESLNVIGGTVGTIAFVQPVNIRQDLHLVKFGLNYHFSPRDVVTARY